MATKVAGYPLSAIVVRATRGEAERVRWRELMSEHHYLGLGCHCRSKISHFLGFA